MNEILKNLYLGDNSIFNQPINHTFITHVLSIGYDTPIFHPSFYININDSIDSDIYKHFNTTFDYIDKIISISSNVLYVHCVAGISRSPTIVLAYLMRKFKWTLEKSQKYLLLKRNIIQPNPGFIKQLKLYEKHEYIINLQDGGYKGLMMELQNISSTGSFIQKQKENIQELDWKLLKCKKCRKPIVTKDDVQTHELGNGHEIRGKIVDSEIKCQLYFVEPNDKWIRKESGMESRMECYYCDAKLGYYNWSGLLCSCGTWITPAFSIQKHKVDMEF